VKGERIRRGRLEERRAGWRGRRVGTKKKGERVWEVW
jgi:hypothetical protein